MASRFCLGKCVSDVLRLCHTRVLQHDAIVGDLVIICQSQHLLKRQEQLVLDRAACICLSRHMLIEPMVASSTAALEADGTANAEVHQHMSKMCAVCATTSEQSTLQNSGDRTPIQHWLDCMSRT